MGHAITVTVELTEINCGRCGGTYAINEQYRRDKAQSGGIWTCPYCQVHWGYADDNENARLKKQLEQERKRRNWAETNADVERGRADMEERRRRAQKAATTRLRRRSKAGLCPCCRRHFKQLAAHMDNKHPDFVTDQDDSA